MNNEKIKEIIRYLIVGVLTTIVSLGIYYGLVYTILNPENGTQLQIANIASWIGAVIFAYITNRRFVFKSQNQNRLKEATSFVSSRLLTLVMDMAIMFIGVTLLKQNDKIIKLISQVVITVANYIFSKLFVFNSNKKENQVKKNISNYLAYGIVFFVPLLDFLFIIVPFKEYTFWLLMIIKGGILLGFSLYLWRLKKERKFLIAILSLISIYVLYNYCKGYDFLWSLKTILEIVFFPIALLFFKNISNEKIDNYLYAKAFLFYAFAFLIPLVILSPEKTFWFYYIKKEVLAILICLLPVTLKVLKDHPNYFSKFLGLFLITLVIIFYQAPILCIISVITFFYFLWEERKKLFTKKPFLIVTTILIISFSIYPIMYYANNFEKMTTTKIEKIEQTTSLFMNSNIDEQIFGISQVYSQEEKNTSFDLLDIFYDLGYFGIILYILLLSYALSKIKVKGIYRLSVLITLLSSFMFGHILSNVSLTLFLTSMLAANKNKPKNKILLVSNMYPSKKFKHYGSFVKNTKESLEKLGFQVDLAVKKKNISFPAKFVGYSWMYIQAIFKSLFYSYDYYYVHFVAQSTFSVIFGRITGKTKLICNVHGNDIVMDYKFEKKNEIRSKISLFFADIVISPSEYFKEVLMDKYHIPEEKIRIYPSGGINFEIFKEKDQQECQKKLDLDRSYKYIGMVSRIEKNKGWDTLLDALNILKKEPFMKKTKVILIGSGEEQKEMKQKVKEYQLEETIIQKEFVLQKDLVDYYNAFDVFIFPTKRKSESLGLVGLEAMACKTFVIACDLYGPKEYTENKKNSLTYQNDNNGKELAEKIKEFINMKETEKQKILNNAYQTAKKYDVTKLEEKLRKIFVKKEED